MNPVVRLAVCLAVLPVAMGCGTTEVVVGEAAGVARIVAGVLGQGHVVQIPDVATDGIAIEQPIGSPGGVVGRDDGSFAFADRVRRRIGIVSADGQLVWTVGRGRCTTPGPGNGEAGAVCFAEPLGLATAADGTLLVTDVQAHLVYRYDPLAGLVTVVLGTGQAGAGADSGLAVASPTNRPNAVAPGPDGALYVAEGGNSRVVRVDPAGRLTVVAGRGEAGDDGDGGPARLAALAIPAGLAWSGDTLFIADAGNHRIRIVVRDTIHGFAGLGARGFAGDRGPAAAALFARPGALAVVGALLFVADRDNHRVRLITLGADSIDTFMGTGRAEAGVDLLEAGRTAIAAPAGVGAAGRGVFVSDSGGVVVRRVIR